MTLLKIILWANDTTKQPRYINFEEGKVNVIRGDSRTGKSALITIIDYVLGSKKCKIPVGPIRETVSWFGILLSKDSNEILIARKSPGIGNAKNIFYFETGEKIKIPNLIKKENMNLDSMKKMFNDIFNYSNLELEDENSFAKRPSFRDSVSLNFQPQTIIANPNVLYYKADSNEHREKLKSFMPYILNILTNQNLSDLYEIKILEKENKNLLNIQKEQEEYLKEYDERIKNIIIEGLSLGIITESHLSIINQEQGYDRLFLLNKIYNSDTIEQLTENNVSVYSQLIESKENDLAVLHDEILKLENQCQSIQNQISYFESSDISAISDRISLVDWLSSKVNNLGKLETVSVEEIQRTINSYKNVNKGLISALSVMQNEIIEKKHLLKMKIEKFNKKQLEFIEFKKSYSENNNKKIQERIFEFKGKIKYEIEFLKNKNNTEIQDKIKQNIIRINELKQRTKEMDRKDRERRILNKLTVYIREYLKELDVDDCISPVKLELQELTLSREKKSSQNYTDKEYLWEIGSASNWLSYHVSAYLAIHHYLNTIENKNQIFNFIVFDQPSQVYFPDNLKLTKNRFNDIDIMDRDIRNVKKIFKSYNDFIEKNKNYQIIVLEHAPQSIWAYLKNVTTKEVWDEENNAKLIPQDWITDKKN